MAGGDAAVKPEPKADLCGSGGSSQLPGFPSGLRVLVVDDDPTCLMVVSAMLKKCNYEVTTSINGMSALEELRQHPNHHDLVLSDVYMPDMDGFKLLEHIGLELDLPVIMMSSNGETNVVLRGVTHGAVDFLIKPVRIEELRNAWQHVVRRRRESAISKDSGEDHDDEAARRHDKKRKSDERRKSGENSDGEGNSAKKARVVWSVEMHQQFVNAVNTLGVDKAVPKRILDLMNVEGLTRENVASHLQKYRLYLKRVSGVSPAAPGGRGGGGKGMRLPGMPGVGHGAAVAANAAPGALPDVMAAAGQSPEAPGADALGAAAAAAVPAAPVAGFPAPPMGMQQAPLLQPGGPGAVPDHIMRMQLQTLQMQAMSLGVGGGLPGAIPGSSAPMMAGGLAAPGMQGPGGGAAPPVGFAMPGGMTMGSMAGMPGLPPGLEYGMPPPGAFTGDMSWANLAGQPGFAGDHVQSGLLTQCTPVTGATMQAVSPLQGSAQQLQQHAQPQQQAQPVQQPQQQQQQQQQPQQQQQQQQHASPPLERDPQQQPQQPQQSVLQHQPLQAPAHGQQHTPQSLQLSFEPHQQQMAAAVGQYPGLPFGPIGPPMGQLPGYPPPVLSMHQQPFQSHVHPQSQPMPVAGIPAGGAGSGPPVPGEDPSSMDDILNYFLKDAAAPE